MTKIRPARRRLPSPGLVVACLALAIALSGVGYAAVAVPRGSVGTAQLKNNAVTSVKIKNGAVKKADLAAGVVPAGPRVYMTSTATATIPVTGVVAVSDTLIRTLTLPKGRYHATAHVLMINESTTVAATPRCYLRGPSGLSGGLNGLVQPLEANAGGAIYRLVLELEGTILLNAPGQLRVECNKGAVGQSLGALANITAVPLASAIVRAD